jgi:heptaprenyl diphosphate synthase
MNIKKNTLKLVNIAIFSALAIVLSALEMSIPALPFMPPGAKLGLSNIVTMYTSCSIGIIPALLIALIKSLFVGVTKGVTAFAMSLCGGILSTIVMWVLFSLKKNPFGIMGVGIAAALAHNLGQLFIAFLITGEAVIYYIPFLIIYSIITGAITGLCLKLIIPALDKLKFLNK